MLIEFKSMGGKVILGRGQGLEKSSVQARKGNLWSLEQSEFGAGGGHDLGVPNSKIRLSFQTWKTTSVYTG